MNQFPETMMVGYEAAHPTIQREELAVPSKTKHRFVSDGDCRTFRDWSGILIVVGVLLVVLIGILPQFAWFQNLTGITSWIQFSKNLFGWH